MIEKALETGTFLEINSQPDRLDLTDVHARAAREAGLKLVIDSDGHQIAALGYVELGVGQARRAWLTKDDVVNTRSDRGSRSSELRKRTTVEPVGDVPRRSRGRVGLGRRVPRDGGRAARGSRRSRPARSGAKLLGLAARDGASRSRTCCATSTS